MIKFHRTAPLLLQKLSKILLNVSMMMFIFIKVINISTFSFIWNVLHIWHFHMGLQMFGTDFF